jgi:pilus assembly protein CpaB
MRILAVLVVVLGIAIAGGAVYYGKLILDHQAIAMRIENQTVRVLAAKQLLKRGDVLGAEHLQWVEWPRHAIPQGAFTSTKAVFGPNDDHVRYVMRAIEPGEPILDVKLSRPNEAGRFIYDLPPGMRAVSIRIDAVSSVSGFVVAGDRVDILLTRKVGDHLLSSVVLQHTEVLAIDQVDDAETSSPRVGRTATVAVTPRDAQKLSVAQQSGKLSLTLRPQDAPVDPKHAPPVDSRELDDISRPGIAPKKTVRVRRGVDNTENVTVE